jgi:hypothetical protein
LHWPLASKSTPNPKADPQHERALERAVVTLLMVTAAIGCGFLYVCQVVADANRLAATIKAGIH